MEISHLFIDNNFYKKKLSEVFFFPNKGKVMMRDFKL
jgi:hypothetical protein